MTEIKEITEQQAVDLWAKAWPSSAGYFKLTSPLRFGGGYSANVGIPKFIGLFLDGELVGINSYHKIDSAIRSRGLWIDPSVTSRDLLISLLKATIARVDRCIWAFVDTDQVEIYTTAGFTVQSGPIADHVTNGNSYYMLHTDPNTDCGCTK